MTDFERQFDQEVNDLEEGRRMPYVTTFERNGMLKMIERLLRTKFGEKGLELVPAIEELNDAEKYLALQDTIVTATTLDEVRRACAEAAAPARRTRKPGNGKRGASKTGRG